MAADARTHGWGEWIDFPGALPSLHRSDAKHPDPLTMLHSTPQASTRNCLRWEVAADSEGMSRSVAARMAGELREEPASLVCLATGASPQRAYELLAAEGRENPALVARARWLKLDEWGGLAMDDPATCEVYLRRTLLDPLQVPADRYMGWHSQPPDPQAECRRVAAWLREHGPIDLLILGIGENGHLGFNEPAEHLQSGPHIAKLAPSSLRHPMLDHSAGQVSYGLTLGIEDILSARRILLLASGGHKATQLWRMFEGPPSPEFPASMLLTHPAVTVLCDRAAASLLPPGLPRVATAS